MRNIPTYNFSCTKCRRAQVLEDQGFPGAIFWHCHDKDCVCGCWKNSERDLKLAKEYYQAKFWKEMGEGLSLEHE